MGWLRVWQRLTGWLALFALALQFAVSFGHIHAEDFASASARTAAAQTSGALTRPGGHHDTNHPHCAICAVVHLAGTLLAPAPPVLALPAALLVARLDAPRPQTCAVAPAASFHARAPPQA